MVKELGVTFAELAGTIKSRSLGMDDTQQMRLFLADRLEEFR